MLILCGAILHCGTSYADEYLRRGGHGGGRGEVKGPTIVKAGKRERVTAKLKAAAAA